MFLFASWQICSSLATCGKQPPVAAPSAQPRPQAGHPPPHPAPRGAMPLLCCPTASHPARMFQEYKLNGVKSHKPRLSQRMQGAESLGLGCMSKDLCKNSTWVGEDSSIKRRKNQNVLIGIVRSSIKDSL